MQLYEMYLCICRDSFSVHLHDLLAATQDSANAE